MRPSAICVVGAGHVGLVTAACLAELGHRVTCVDVDEDRVESLRSGSVPIHEPGLDALIARHTAGGALKFTTSYEEALEGVEFIFVAVNTPSTPEGAADLRYVRRAARQIGHALKNGRPIIVNKSTVPVGTAETVDHILRQEASGLGELPVVSNPEFLREGTAIEDFMKPDRVVLGCRDREAARRVADLYGPLEAPVLITDPETAEMIKYASNAFLATKISFINEIANICEALGADIKEVAAGMGYDPRIGREMLQAGLGYGGSCFPKDVKALAYMAAEKGRHPQLLQAVMEINADRRRQLVDKLRGVLGNLRGKTIGLLGLTFKPNTDDLREAPALAVAAQLLAEGARLRAYDPVGMPGATGLMPEIEMTENPYDLAEGCDALVVATEWNEFKQLDLPRLKEAMRQPVVIDGRNMYDPPKMSDLGFTYRAFGRGFNQEGIPFAEAPRR